VSSATGRKHYLSGWEVFTYWRGRTKEKAALKGTTVTLDERGETPFACSEKWGGPGGKGGNREAPAVI